MKIFHLDIKDETDSRFDVHIFYTHSDESKTIENLQEDYNAAYDYISELTNDWDIGDVFHKLEGWGWNYVEVPVAKVRY